MTFPAQTEMLFSLPAPLVPEHSSAADALSDTWNTLLASTKLWMTGSCAKVGTTNERVGAALPGEVRHGQWDCLLGKFQRERDKLNLSKVPLIIGRESSTFSSKMIMSFNINTNCYSFH